jgi:hypothetical protein
LLGDSFPLFSASSYAGAFAALNLPSLSGGLTWTNRLLVDGATGGRRRVEVLRDAGRQLSRKRSGFNPEKTCAGRA